MALKLFLGNSGCGKTEYMYKEAVQKAEADLRTNFLVVVPEQFTLQTQRKLVDLSTNHAIMNIDILSFLRLSYRIFDEIGAEDRPVLEDTGKTLVLRKVLEEKKEELSYFRGNIKKAGFVDEIKSLLSELFQYSIDVEELERMISLADKKPMLQKKLQDVFIIYKAFKDYLKERPS